MTLTCGSSSSPGEAVVVGGGLSGLAASYRLARDGWRVVVLEKEAEVGGRCRTASMGSFLFDTGAQHCRDSYDTTLKTAIDLGLGERFRIPFEKKGIYHRGKVEQFKPRSVNPLSLLPWRSMGIKGLFDAPSVSLPLLRRYRSFNIKFPGWWRYEDDATAESFLSGRTSLSFRRGLAEPLSLYFDGTELNEISAGCLLVAIRCMVADRTIGFTTGMGSLASALAQKVEVVTGMEVTEILTRGRHARGVRAKPAGGGMARSFSADAVVCSVPAPTAASICIDLDQGVRSLMGEARYSKETVVNLAFEMEAGATAGPILLPRDEGFLSSWVCTNAGKAHEYAPEGGSVVTVVFSINSTGGLVPAGDGALVELALSEAARLYDLNRAALAGYRIDSHEFARPVVSPGHARRVSRLMEEGSGINNLALAGDWTSSPTVEGAITSGFLAAERVVAVA